MMKDMIKRVVDEMRWYRSEIDRGIKPTAYIQANSGVIGNGINTIEKLLEENQQLKS